MAKTYKVPYSAIYSVSGTGNDLSKDSGDCRAGKTSSRNYGTYAEFAGLNDIPADKITGITLYLQRVTGGANMTYSVELYYSVLSATPWSGDTLRVRTGYPMFTANRVSWTWQGQTGDTSGVYRTISIPVSLLQSLISYGWCIARRDQTRYITIGDVYLEVTTSEPEYSTVRIKQGDTLKEGMAYVKAADGTMRGCILYQKTEAGTMVLSP